MKNSVFIGLWRIALAELLPRMARARYTIAIHHAMSGADMTDQDKQSVSGRALLQVNLPEAQYQADMALFEDGQKLSVNF